MSVYRRSSIPAPLRTEVCADDLRHLGVVQRILALLNEPAASARELAGLITEMPVLAARLTARFATKVGDRSSTVYSELAFLGNRELEAVLFELLEELTTLRADQEGVSPNGSMFPARTSVPPSPHSS